MLQVEGGRRSLGNKARTCGAGVEERQGKGEKRTKSDGDGEETFGMTHSWVGEG